jgi:hypothetical protein
MSFIGRAVGQRDPKKLEGRRERYCGGREQICLARGLLAAVGHSRCLGLLSPLRGFPAESRENLPTQAPQHPTQAPQHPTQAPQHPTQAPAL